MKFRTVILFSDVGRESFAGCKSQGTSSVICTTVQFPLKDFTYIIHIKLFTKCLFGRVVFQMFLRIMNSNLIKSNVEVRLFFQKKYMNIPSHAYGIESDCVGLYFNLHCLCLLP